MIAVNVKTGSPEWVRARLAIPTASNFDRLITPKTMKLSSQAEGYARELIAEQVLGRPMQDFSTEWTIRGSVLEEKAVEYYELYRGVDTQPSPFFLRNDRRVGATPDRLVGADGLVEIKCPKADVHIAYLLDGGIGYRHQTQGQLYVAEREWIDTISFNPEMPTAIVRVGRDEEFITKLDECVEQFLALLDDMKDKLIRLGYFPNLSVAPLRVA